MSKLDHLIGLSEERDPLQIAAEFAGYSRERIHGAVGNLLRLEPVDEVPKEQGAEKALATATQFAVERPVPQAPVMTTSDQAATVVESPVVEPMTAEEATIHDLTARISEHARPAAETMMTFGEDHGIAA